MNLPGTVAIVLAGGKSSRMGMPKPWLRWGDEFLLQRIVRIVGEAVESVVIVTAKDSELPPLPYTVKIVVDAIPDCGPLGGLVTGLEHFGSEIESAILVACDLPLIQPQFIQSLHLGECDAAVPRIDGRCHPLLAAYSPSCLAIARMQLQAGQYRMADFLERLKVRELGLADLPEIESLRTANTPEEWQELLKESRG